METSLFILRILMGLLMLSAGLEKVLAKGGWSSKEFLENANGPLAPLYHKLIGTRWVDLLNMWGLTLGGVMLILGAFVKLAGFFSALLMLLYYFGYKPKSVYLVFKETLIYAYLFLVLAASGAGFFWGLDVYLSRFIPLAAWYSSLFY